MIDEIQLVFNTTEGAQAIEQLASPTALMREIPTIRRGRVRMPRFAQLPRLEGSRSRSIAVVLVVRFKTNPVVAFATAVVNLLDTDGD